MVGGVTIPSKLEIALGPDRSADPLSWTWRDVTTDTRTNALTIRRGRSEGATLAEPGSFTVPMFNGDGRYSPRNPESMHYPNIVRGMPVRHSSTFGARQLGTTGATTSRASTPDAASLDIVGDISGVVEFGSPVRLPPFGFAYLVAGKFTTAGNQRSYKVSLSADGTFRLTWSADGTNELLIRSTLGFPRPDAGPISYGWWLDVNNGAAGRTMRFYMLRGTAAELLANPAAALYETITESGTTSIFASTAALDVGGINGNAGGVLLNYPGWIRRFHLRAGDLTTGTVVANPDFTTQAEGATTFTDTAAVAKTWTVNSPAVVTATKTTMVGELTGNHPVWPANAAPATPQAVWEVSGILRRLRQGTKPLRSSLYRLVTGRLNASSLVAYWPFEDSAGSLTAAAASANTRPAFVSAAVKFGAESSYVASEPLASVQSGLDASFLAPVEGADPSVTSWRAELFFKIPTPATAASGGTTLMIVTSNGTAAQYAIWIDDTNVLFDIKTVSGTVLASGTFGSDPRFFDVWALVTLGFKQSGGNIAYDIGIVPEEGSGAGALFGTSGTFAGTVGTPTSVQTTFPAAPPDGISFGHIIVTEGNPVGWLSPGDSAYVGEPATSRFFRLCSEEGIPGLVDGIHSTLWGNVTAADSPTRTMGPQRPLTFLTLLEECAQVEQGYVGESRELFGLTLRGYRSLLDQTPALTVARPMNPFAPTDDDQRLVNDMTAKRVNGSSVRYTDTASIAASGTYDDEKEYNVELDSALASYAGWRVTRALWPEMRYPQLSMKVVDATNPILDTWYDTSVGDVIAVNTLPAQHPTASIAQILEGYTQTISPYAWELELNGSPAGPFTVGQLDSVPASPNVALARLDSNGSTLSAGITATATSLSVAVAAGSLLWTTSASHRPFDILIGGERMTVTNLTGAASPQTFTVSRSVNGIVKAHSSGAQVHVFYPLRLTL